MSSKISRLLAKHKIKAVHIPAKKTINMLRPVKDNLGLRTCGIYCIPCKCSKVYVGQTSSTIEIRRQEHIRHLGLCQPEKSAVAELKINTGHEIKFERTQKLSRTTTYMDCIVKGGYRNTVTSQKLQQGGWVQA